MTQPCYPLCIAAAPIFWGVWEVPGWGHVHTEMAALGISATELGLLGYLPRNPAESRSLLDDFDVTSVGCFLTCPLHVIEQNTVLRPGDSAKLPGRDAAGSLNHLAGHRFRAGLSPICLGPIYLGPICLGPNLDGK